MANAQQGGRKNHQGCSKLCEGAGASLVAHSSSQSPSLSPLTAAQGDQGRGTIQTKLFSRFLRVSWRWKTIFARDTHTHTIFLSFGLSLRKKAQSAPKSPAVPRLCSARLISQAETEGKGRGGVVCSRLEPKGGTRQGWLP